MKSSVKHRNICIDNICSSSSLKMYIKCWKKKYILNILSVYGTDFSLLSTCTTPLLKIQSQGIYMEVCTYLYLNISSHAVWQVEKQQIPIFTVWFDLMRIFNSQLTTLEASMLTIITHKWSFMTYHCVSN